MSVIRPFVPDRRTAAFLLVPLGFTAVVYWRLTGVYFQLDDWINLQEIANGPVLRYVLQPFAGHVVIVRNALFYASYEAFGMAAPAWFSMVLLTHLVNVALLFAVVRVLCGPRVACLVATLWGSAPMHEGTLAWYAVYGQVVAATLVLGLLLDMARCAVAERTVSTRRALVWSAVLVVASMSFGIAIGMAVGFPVVAWFAFGSRGVTRRGWVVLSLLPLFVATGYVGVHKLYAILYGGPPGVYADTLRTVRWRDVSGMCVYLFAAGVGGLVAGLASPLGPGVKGPALGLVSPLAREWNPLLVAVVATYAIGVLGVLVVGPPRARRWNVAMLALAGCGYGIIAVGRANIYGEMLKLGGYGAAELRYHYLPPIPLAIGLALVLGAVGSVLPAWKLNTALLAGVLTALAAAWMRSAWHIDQHTWSRDVALQAVTEMRRAIAAGPAGEPLYLPNQWFAPAIAPRTYFSGTAALYVIYFPRDEGRPVYFIEKDPAVRGSVVPGTRLARILVPSDAVPQPAAETRQ